MLDVVIKRLADQYAHLGITLSVRPTRSLRDDMELVATRVLNERGFEVTRFASVNLDGRTLRAIHARGEPGALIDFVMHYASELVRILTPKPPPVFRIGTRHHPKRLVARAA